MNFTFLLLLMFSIHISSIFSQSVNFGVLFKGNEIGNIEATKHTSDTVINYKVISNVDYNTLLYDYQRSTTLSISISSIDQRLLACKSKVTKGGDLEEYKVTRWKDGRYECFSDDGTRFTLDTTITYTAGTLYFAEPEGLPHVFSESYQELCPINNMGDHTYEITLPGGKTNHYIYEDGMLQEVKVFRSFFNLTFRRK